MWGTRPPSRALLVRSAQCSGEGGGFAMLADDDAELVAPALRIHPATDTLLRYLAPEIEWQLIAVDEHWREGVRVVFRKHSVKAKAAAGQQN